ncbi:MAG TPA: cytochrome b/b6 domain-containing protein [Steroidobacteraceae bacterium]|nr:cytochrome b/b6 domain-containing protein [Steroidobacteraceae bacterium]
MNLRLWAVIVGLLASASALTSSAARVTESAPRASIKSLHPDFALLDANSVNVLKSGQGVSTTRTCGQCHDTNFISSHAFHVDLGLRSYAPSRKTWNSSPGLFGEWDPLRYRFLTQSGDERLDLSTAEWLMLNGKRVVGGGPATTSRSGKPLTILKSSVDDPETSLLNAAGNRTAWNWSASGTMEPNCFLCHLERPNLAARMAAIRAGRFSDANTASLLGLNVVEAGARGWTWNRAAFTAGGFVESKVLQIQAPTNANCAGCHGEVHPGTEPLNLHAGDLDYPQTATTGQVISSQRINASGVNFAGKNQLTRSWDIHAERQLQCTDCHYAPNNPAHVTVAKGRSPAHLRYDPRSLDIDKYLQRPDHDLARGQSAQFHVAPEYKGTMRRCENCHDATASHGNWLPYVETHMAAVACESCHIPKMYAPAIQSYDWTVLKVDGKPVQSYRGVNGAPEDARSLVTGFEPVLLKRTNLDGTSLLAPYNLITTFYWVYEDANGNKRPVRLADLQAAFLDGGAYAADIVTAFDGNHDGVIGPAELRIDTPQKEAAVKARLAKLGLQHVRIEGQVQPFSINHNVARGEHALNDCRACHAAGSRVTQGMSLAGFAPVLPVFDTNNNVTGSGDLIRQNDGALFYRPGPIRDAVYVFGATRLGWLDGLGALAFVATLFGVIGHGVLRYLAFKKRPHGHALTRRLHIYDAYRRFWHWLQAISIVILLLTGLVIHRPDLFDVFSFSAVVSLHNILAALLVINAALSLFYHLATERLQEYIPRPYGFFDDAITQAKYYVSGIFKGEPHPFEKSPDDRMNPLQKLTYFGVLNVLLPLQIVTGALMWGVQKWPEVASAFGGLPVLAPFHSLVAWLFASFILGHVYLTTTGATPLEAIRGMVTGDEEIEVHEEGDGDAMA